MVIEIIHDLNKIGIYLVPVGELEGWMNLETKRKNKWIIKALDKIFDNDASESLIAFIKQIIEHFK